MGVAGLDSRVKLMSLSPIVPEESDSVSNEVGVDVGIVVSSRDKTVPIGYGVLDKSEWTGTEEWISGPELDVTAKCVAEWVSPVFVDDSEMVGTLIRELLGSGDKLAPGPKLVPDPPEVVTRSEVKIEAELVENVVEEGKKDLGEGAGVMGGEDKRKDGVLVSSLEEGFIQETSSEPELLTLVLSDCAKFRVMAE